MAAEWKETTLGDAADLLTGFPFKSSNYTESMEGIALVRGDNVVQGQFRWDDVKRWPADNTAELSDYYLSAGDVVLAMDRPWIEAGLKYACVAKDDLPCLLVQRVSRLRARNGLDQSFLRYIIGSKEFTNYVLGIQTGTAVPHISSGQIKQYRFLCPTPAEQRRIASVLGALDDNIRLNQQMNETLGSMAQSLFKSLFLVVTQSVLPEGWREGKVGELATLNRDSLNPGAFPEETFDHYSIPAFDKGQTPKPETGDTIKSNKFIVPPNCVMVSKLNPRIPRIWLPDLRGPNRAVSSTEFLIATPKPGSSREFLYCLFKDETFANLFTTMVTGTSGSHQRVKPDNLLAMDTVIPPQSLISSFTEASAPLFQRINHNIAESRTLAALRDALLPKLLSGEAQVGQVEQ